MDDSETQEITVAIDQLDTHPAQRALRLECLRMVAERQDVPADEIVTRATALVEKTRQDLVEDSVSDVIKFLWREYVLANPAELTMDATDLRDDLLRTFSGAEHAGR